MILPEVIVFARDVCGSLKENDPIGSSTNRKCGFVGVSMVLLDEVTVGVDFEISYAQATPSDTVHFLLSLDQM